MTINAYPELPQLPYEATTVAMTDVIAYLQAMDAPTEVKRSCYCIFRTESGSGAHGICQNYIGAQADGARWPDKWTPLIAGTVTEPENGTGRTRIFLAFDRWQTSIDMLAEEVTSRGLYVGPTVLDDANLALKYYRMWVTGDPSAQMPEAAMQSFVSMYGQAMALFRDASLMPSDATMAAANPPPAAETADDLNADVLDDKPIPGTEG
jgi:hypothetical protein